MTTRTTFYVKHMEIDRMNIVYHVNYPRWFEVARTDYLKKAGISNSHISNRGFYLPLSEIQCKFKSPAKFRDEIAVTTAISYMSCVKLKFEYKVINIKSGKLIAVGYSVHAWTDKNITPLNIEKTAPDIFSTLKVFSEKANFLDNVGNVSFHESFGKHELIQ